MKSLKYIVLALAVLSLLPAVLPAQELATEDDKMLYAVGLALAQQLGSFGLTEAELVVVQQGITDAALKREAKVDLMSYGPKLQGFAQARMTKASEGEKAASTAFLEKMAAEEGTEKTSSGLLYKEITAGDGDHPLKSDTVTVHYHGTLRDGSVFDSSVDRGDPASFPLTGVIPCWTEGVQKIKVGGKSRLICPSDIAYGDNGRPGIPGGAALVFEVELLSIGAATPPAPQQ